MNLSGMLALALGPALFVLTGLALNVPGHPAAGWCAAAAVWMVVWWVFEVVPLAATALLPLVLFPLFGVMHGKAVAGTYVNPVIFLFVGGFLVAIAMQRWGLHRRLALALLIRVGASPRRMLLGFMGATALLSMWISNTATTMMMVPLVLAVLDSFERRMDPGLLRRLAVAWLLGVAYAASIGGIVTLVGTPPNLSLVRILAISFPGAPELAFNQWMVLALPISLAFFLLVYGLLCRRFLPRTLAESVPAGRLKAELEALGPITPAERRVAIVFVLLALAWLTRADLRLGDSVIPGWESLLPHHGLLNDGAVAVFMALWLFLLPGNAKGERLLDGEALREVPWDIVLLFGGGFALATGIRESGLASWIAGHASALAGMPVLAVIAMLCLTVTFATELTSNTATAETILPVVAAVAVALGLHPLLLMIPATISCSLAFMLPVATPPNAIVFGSGRLRVRDMATTGLILNLAGVLLVTGLVASLGSWALGVDLWRLPDWARFTP